jgi:flavin-dependent dehydrogenase
LRIEETRHIAPRLRRFGRTLEFRVSAARSFRLESPTGPGWLAVGDAAMAVDPLSSMGILSALRSGVAAAATITAHLSGDEAALGRYSAEVAERFKTYLVERSAVYATERRWRALPFWKRRAGSPLSLVT